ncbi:MAG TPA: substrate-binding domain-containing protein, partial [Pyrinomonadaceae bacterium]|nr:substrate-binding domain-containing protein [Pyrinomonadaceae bacterium]
MRLKILVLLLFAFFIGACVQTRDANNTAQTNKPTDANKKIKIGFAMDTLKEERWVRDKDAFEAHCKKLDVECIVTVAGNSAANQMKDVEGLLTKGIDVLVIAPHDAKQAASMVDKAK